MGHKQNPSDDGDGRRSLFGQTHRLLASMNPRIFRTNQRFWSVMFAGEGAEDVGGPFREHIAEMCSELMSNATPLFIPTPNNRHNTGRCRDCFFPSEKCTSALYLSMLRFLGNLMGGAIRSAEPLGLYFPSAVWKLLVKQSLDISDLEGIDHLCVQCVEHIRNIEKEGVSKEEFDTMFSTETFTTQLCDGSVVELIEGGGSIALTFERRFEHCDLLVSRRLAEANAQIEAMRLGLIAVVPEYLLCLMTWEDLEYKVCGQPDYTVQELRSTTTYEGLSKDDPRIQYLWEVLESVTPNDRRNFLKFVSGRERLPVRLRVMAMSPQQGSTSSPDGFSSANADSYLPKAATCFFALELPPYSSAQVLKEKLLYAISHCGDIDTDFHALEHDEDEAPQLAVDGVHLEDSGAIDDPSDSR